MPISKAELLQGRDVTYASDYTQEISDNLDALLVPMNLIRTLYGNIMVVNSGWRPPAVNVACGGAPGSKHMEGLACDISDVDGSLWKWLMLRLDTLQEMKIYLEDKRWTSSDTNGGWCHFQLGGPASGHRIFIPNSYPPTSSKWFNGIYPLKYDGDIPFLASSANA